MILRGLRKYAHEMDRLGLGILPDNRRTDEWCASSERIRHGRVSATAAIQAGRVPMMSTLYDASNSQLAYNISVTTFGGSY